MPLTSFCFSAFFCECLSTNVQELERTEHIEQHSTIGNTYVVIDAFQIVLSEVRQGEIASHGFQILLLGGIYGEVKLVGFKDFLDFRRLTLQLLVKCIHGIPKELKRVRSRVPKKAEVASIVLE